MDISFIIISVIFVMLIAWNIILTLKYAKIVSKNKELFGTENKDDIYSLINNYLIKARTIEKQNESVISEFGKITENYANCLQKIGIVRYNPFNDVGGDQSFSLAILDKRDNGLIITSMHGRGANRVYAKPIKNKISEYNLSTEELQALERAGKPVKERSKNV